MHQNLIKKKSEPKIEESIAERTKLRRQKDKKFNEFFEQIKIKSTKM